MKTSSSDGSAISNRATPVTPLEHGVEDRLRVDLARHGQLDVVGPRPGDPHAGERVQPAEPVRAVGTTLAVQRDPDDLPTGRPLDVTDGAADHDPAAIDDDDRLAQRLDGLHLMGREDQRLAAAAHLEEGVPQDRAC